MKDIDKRKAERKNKLKRFKSFFGSNKYIVIGALVLMVLVGVSLKFIFQVENVNLIQVLTLLGICMGLIVPALIQRVQLNKLMKEYKQKRKEEEKNRENKNENNQE